MHCQVNLVELGDGTDYQYFSALSILGKILSEVYRALNATASGTY